MKIILSRKGFDASAGGTPSPVMPDGAMLSMPIPDFYSDDYYENIGYGDRTYMDILTELCPKKSFCETCHFDPDLRKDIHLIKTPRNWKPIFGQCDVAERHLENQGVTVGDVFMFFGWFRQTEEVEGKLRYIKDAPEAHMLYGYLQIGKIIQGEELEKYDWHPHAYNAPTNTMYVASKKLVIDGEDTGLSGAGTFQYSKKLVLSAPGYNKRIWKLPKFFQDVYISYHTADSFTADGYFESARRGQEFVVSESPKVTNWARKIIEGHTC